MCICARLTIEIMKRASAGCFFLLIKLHDTLIVITNFEVFGFRSSHML